MRGCSGLLQKEALWTKRQGIDWPLCGQTTTGMTLWHKISILKWILSNIHYLLWSRTNLANLDIPSEAVPTLTSQSTLIIAPQCAFCPTSEWNFISHWALKCERRKFVKLLQSQVVQFSCCHSARLNISSNFADTWSEAADLDAWIFF